MSSKASLLLFVLAASSFAATRIDRITPTATQATINVVTDQPGNCTYRVSQLPGFVPLVNDSNASLFTGSNSDARAGSIVDAKNHVFVSGTRTASQASDGKSYSRALQANTQHFVGVTCGTDAEVTAQFTTQNPPFGNSYPETAPFNNAAFGNYAWPSIDFTDQTKLYIDPMTGVALKRITSPGWNGRIEQNTVFSRAIDIHSAWANSSKATTWPGSSANLATYSGTASDPLFLAADLSVTNDYIYGAIAVSGWSPLTAVDDILVRTYGYGSAIGTGQEINRTILACLSLDSGQTCSTPEQSIILPPSSAANGPTAPATGFPTAAWTDWATTAPFLGRDFGTVISTVTTSGNTLTNTGTASSQMFSRNWGVGCKLLVNGSETYTIAAVLNSTTITTAETMTTHASAVTFRSQCAGVRIRKQTATGTVNVSLGYDAALSQEFSMPLTGVRSLCSQLTTTVSVDANGAAASPRQARLCAALEHGSAGHVLFAFFSDNGETRFLSNFNAHAGFQYHSPDWVLNDGNYPDGGAYTTSDVWDATTPTRFYTDMPFAFGPSATKHVLVRVDYTGAFTSYKPFSSTNGYNPSGSAWPDDSITYNVIGGYPSDTTDHSIEARAAAFGNAQFNPSIFTNWTFAGVIASQGVAVWSVGPAASSEVPTILVYQSLSTGAVTQMIDTISTYPLRFWGTHTSQILGGQLITIANILGNKGVSTSNYLGGPFVLYPTAVQQSGVWNSNTAIDGTYAEACPTGSIAAQWQALGAIGTNCLKIRAKQPCSDYAGATELANYPCPWDGTKSMVSTVAPGDRFWIGFPSAPSGETMRIVTTPVSVGTGIVEFWALRHSENFNGLGGDYGGTGDAHANGWTAGMIPPEARMNATAMISGSGVASAENWTFGATHSGLGPAANTGAVTAVVSGANPITGAPDYYAYGIRTNSSLASQIGQLPQFNLTQNGYFGGVDNGAGAMESYVSNMQNQAPANERKWFLDLHHMNPSSGVVQESKAGVGNITAALVSGTSNTYVFTAYPGSTTFDVKHSNPIAYAGSRLLTDISGPSSLINDSTPDSYCVAYSAGECQPSSSAGNVYTSVPKSDAPSSNCISGWYGQTMPCVLVPHSTAGWALQYDASRPASDENFYRKLTMGFSGIGRQYQFGNITPEPDGQWSFIQCYWCGGVRNDVFAVKMPPMPPVDTATRSDFITVPVSVSAGPGVFARAKFGYAENGTVSAHYCSTRQEVCVTDASTAPFAYLLSDTLNPNTCASGCTLNIPAIAGRVLYYRVERLDVSGNIVATGPETVVTPGAAAAPALSSSVNFTMGSGGMNSLTYNGQSFFYSGHGGPAVVSVSLTDSGGNVTSGSTSPTSTTTNGNTVTQTFTWGVLNTTYQAVGNKLLMSCQLKSTSTSTITKLWIYPAGVLLPSTPVSPPGTPLNQNEDGPSSMFFNFTSGVADVVNEDVTAPLITGFKANDSPIGQHWYMMMYTDNNTSFGNFHPTNRSIAPGGSDTYTISLRFGPAGATEPQLAGDLFNQYGATFPQMLPAAHIQHPIAYLSLTSKRRPVCATNPRGWFSADCSVDVTTPSGITAFQTRLLAYADTSIAECARVGCQGFINWNLDGVENDGAYDGDPSQYETIAPELVGVLDTYMAKFTNAGYKVGILLRPQIYSQVKGTATVSGTSVTWASGAKFDPNWFLAGGDFVINELTHFSGTSVNPGADGYVASVNSTTSLTLSASGGSGTFPFLYAQHANDPNPGANIRAKIQYAVNRWGASLFYIDSNTNFQTGVVNPAADYARMIKDFPGIMLFPEQQNTRHYAYAAPFNNSGQAIEPPASVLAVYPNAYQLSYINDSYATAHPDLLLKAAQDGNILLYDGWYRHTANDVIQGIYAQLP